MDERDLQSLSTKLGVVLPPAVRNSLLDNPFPADSYAREFELPDDVGMLIELNENAPPVRGVPKPFFVGSDGGEESYFIDTSEADGTVYSYSLETGQHSVKSRSWGEHLEQIRAVLAEIEADEARMAGRRWWQFWK